MAKLKAGIIGLGVGEAHIAGYQLHEDCEVVSICDIDEGVVSRMREKYSDIQVLNDPDKLLDDPTVDIVSIASYDNFHYEQILKAVESGKHVFVEKPLCLYEHEALGIAKVLDEHPEIQISSNLILRKSQRFIELKQGIADGEFGEIFHLSGAYNYGRLEKITKGWRGELDFYSAVHGGGVHIVDLFMWLTGDVIEEVFAYGNNLMTKDSKFSNMDMITSVLKFKSGIVANVSINFACVHPHFHQVEIYGSKASFINDLPDGRMYKQRDANEYTSVDSAYPGVHKGDLLYKFVESIKNNTEPEVSRKDIFDCMAVCFAIEKSVYSGQAEKVNYIN